jgi:HIRAN domain
MTIGSVALLILVSVVVWFLVRRSPSRPRSSATPTNPVGSLQGPGTYETEVVGESHYQPALASICGGRSVDGVKKHVQATLVLEDQNPHDNQAVRIDVSDKTVGYLPRDTARNYRIRLREAGYPRLIGHCNAEIRGGWDRGPQDRGNFGIWLDLPSK